MLHSTLHSLSKVLLNNRIYVRHIWTLALTLFIGFNSLYLWLNQKYPLVWSSTANGTQQIQRCIQRNDSHLKELRFEPWIAIREYTSKGSGYHVVYSAVDQTRFIHFRCCLWQSIHHNCQNVFISYIASFIVLNIIDRLVHDCRFLGTRDRLT